jgi:hypothetical protein
VKKRLAYAWKLASNPAAPSRTCLLEPGSCVFTNPLHIHRGPQTPFPRAPPEEESAPGTEEKRRVIFIAFTRKGSPRHVKRRKKAKAALSATANAQPVFAHDAVERWGLGEVFADAVPPAAVPPAAEPLTAMQPAAVTSGAMPPAPPVDPATLPLAASEDDVSSEDDVLDDSVSVLAGTPHLEGSEVISGGAGGGLDEEEEADVLTAQEITMAREVPDATGGAAKQHAFKLQSGGFGGGWGSRSSTACAAQHAAPLLIGISGCSRSGKSTLASHLQDALHPLVVEIVQQDCFFSHRALTSGNWESPQAVDHDKFAAAVRRAVARHGTDVVLCEGFQAFHDPALTAEMALRLWLDVSESTARARRAATAPVLEGYFDECIWPHHLEYRGRALDEAAGRGYQSSLVRIDGDGQLPRRVVEAALGHVRRALADATSS